MKILVIDDDDSLSSVYEMALKKEGYEVLKSPTGQEGINLATTASPNLILLDQVLPDISGNEVLKKLKTDEKTKNIPVVLLSNFSQEELVKEAINQGAADYIFKYQVEINDVISKIKEVLNHPTS